MAYKSILTHIVADRGCSMRLRMAAGVARAFGAELTGLGAQAPWPFADASDGGGREFEHLVQQARAHIGDAERAFRAGVTASGLETAWREDVAYPNVALVRHARATDLVLAYRTSRGADLSTYADPDAVVMEVGLPVLIMPGRELEFTAGNVLLAWKNTREARRAISVALPILEGAKRVVVAAVCHARDVEAVEKELRDVNHRLSRHGVKSTTLVEVDAPGAAGRKLLRIAQTEDSDLIVAGGYGHSRLREWVMGGVTHDLIADTRRYVLLSH